ncbi:MAG: hypothetical protein FGM33_04350 [Candidatus Kapabacteria bacterium]|nr:hypothetical protein [Candidatus Kapabacteria bacterium]
MIRPLLILALAISCVQHLVAAPPPDAKTLLLSIRKRMESSGKYSADLRLKVDIPFIKAPEARATLAFTPPNSTKITAKGFAMIPKQSTDLSALSLLSGEFAAIDMGTENWKGQTLRKIKVIPADESANIVLATLFIDADALLTRKVVATSKAGGSVTAEMIYDNAKAAAFCLPSYMKIMMEVPNFEIPRTITGDFNESSQPKKPADPNGKTKATVEIWYETYRF